MKRYELLFYGNTTLVSTSGMRIQPSQIPGSEITIPYWLMTMMTYPTDWWLWPYWITLSREANPCGIVSVRGLLTAVLFPINACYNCALKLVSHHLSSFTLGLTASPRQANVACGQQCQTWQRDPQVWEWMFAFHDAQEIYFKSWIRHYIRYTVSYHL